MRSPLVISRKSISPFARARAVALQGIVTDGLVMHIDANNADSYSGSGGTWLDLTENNNDGTLFQSGDLPTFVDSGTNKSIEFNTDVENQYVNFGDVLDSGTSDFTINIWAYMLRTKSNNQWIFSKSIATGAEDRLGIFQVANSTKLGFLYDPTGSLGQSTGTTSYNLNQWYMITFLVDKSLNVTLYVNGTPELVVDRSAYENTPIDSPFPYRFATYSSNPTYLPLSSWRGRLSIAQHYTKALSVSEIQQNFNADKAKFGY